MNNKIKKGDRVFVISHFQPDYFGCVHEIKEDTVVVMLKMESMGRLVGDQGNGIIDATPRFREFSKSKVFPAKEYVEKKIKLLAKRLHNLTEFL